MGMHYETLPKKETKAEDLWRVTRWLDKGGYSYYVTSAPNHYTVAYVADAADATYDKDQDK